MKRSPFNTRMIFKLMDAESEKFLPLHTYVGWGAVDVEAFLTVSLSRKHFDVQKRFLSFYT